MINGFLCVIHTFQARRFYRLYIENISERLNCNLETISATDNLTAVSFFSQAKSLSKVGSKLFQRMKSNMNGIHWEMPHNPHCIDPKERLQDMEVPIRGMDIALSSCTTFPVSVVDEELRDTLLNCRGRYNQKLDQPDNLFAPLDTTTNLESKKKILNKSIFKAYKDLPTAFFLYCLQLLLEKSSSVAKKTNHVVENSLEDDDSKGIFRKIRELAMKFIPSRHSLVFALKCSLTLGLAMLFGLTYSKDSGYWSGLAVAISFDTRRQPTFWATNARMQGTAVGSIYGVLSCFIFHKYVDLRLLPLLPWVVFYTFLRHSRLYGQAGAISAVIGALPILGREHYGPPKQFAIARIAEVSIGLICFLIVEIILSPSRAATLARTQLSRTFRALQDCIGKISIIIPRENHQSSSSSQELREAQKKMKCLVSQMEAFIVEAELEPSFWFLPFHGACYRKMLESLSRIVDLLLFVAYSMEHISELSQKVGGSWVDLQDQMHENVESVKKNVCPTLKFLEEITQIKSLTDLEKELKKRNVPCDIESGEYPNADTFRTLSGDEEVDSITESFLKHLEDIASKSDNNTDEEMVKCEMLFHYSCLGFCISNLVREIIKIENELRELLLMWENENPSGLSNMKEIYCKISILCSR
ncbi:hypothetical protein PIB30_026687 [Stylosanthes scabra]|uniref:Integral membrane bound transporter domain-containing protein n=1 Tax=Stylosanthes scabra TaxID=79078 RepID=A0ABU6RAQ7_9FABA|nr:hypothetical protein [Stylosanthes scabra]